MKDVTQYTHLVLLGPQLPHTQNKDSNPVLHTADEELNAIMLAKCFAHCLGCRKRSINAGYHHYLGK